MGIHISVLCQGCGKRIRRDVDPLLPPSTVRCSGCGDRYELNLGDEPATHRQRWGEVTVDEQSDVAPFGFHKAPSIDNGDKGSA